MVIVIVLLVAEMVSKLISCSIDGGLIEGTIGLDGINPVFEVA